MKEKLVHKVQISFTPNRLANTYLIDAYEEVLPITSVKIQSHQTNPVPYTTTTEGVKNNET